MILSRILPALGLLFLPSLAFASFSDVPSNHPNADAINYVQAQGIVSGYPDGTFKPYLSINRAEFTKIIIGSNFNEQALRLCQGFGFSDTSTDAWYTPYVCLAAQHHIIAGYPDGTFRPNTPISFAEAAKIVALVDNFYYNGDYFNNTMANGVLRGTPLPESTDGMWYESSVRYLSQKNAIPTTVLSFTHSLSRGEMAEMIYRLKTGTTDKLSQTYDGLQGKAALSSPTATDTANVNRDFQRSTDINHIMNAVRAYRIDYGNLPAGIPLNQSEEICRDDACGPGFVNLQMLVGPYLASIPRDPMIGNTGETRYFIQTDAAGHITVTAPDAETRTVSATY